MIVRGCSVVNTNNSPSQDYTTNPDDHSNHNIGSPGFKPLAVICQVYLKFDIWYKWLAYLVAMVPKTHSCDHNMFYNNKFVVKNVDFYVFRFSCTRPPLRPSPSFLLIIVSDQWPEGRSKMDNKILWAKSCHNGGVKIQSADFNWKTLKL